MTVSSATNEATFPGNGVATAFPLPFRFFANSNIIAQLINNDTGAVADMTLGIDYSLTGAGEPEIDGNATGTLTTVEPVPTGFSVFVRRELPLTQPTDIVNQGRFFPEVHETVFDRLLMQIQQQTGASGKALRVIPSEPSPSFLPPIVQRANKILAFDSDGNPVAVVPVTDSSAALRIDLEDFSDAGKGAGIPVFNDALEYPEGSVGRALTALFESTARYIHVQNAPFNAVGDGVVDDTAAINSALTFAGLNGIQFVQLGKTHLVSGTLFVPCGVVLRGQGRGKNRACRIIPAAGTYVGGWVVMVNSTDGSTWAESFPNTDAGGAEHIQFWNGDEAGTPNVTPLRGAIGFGPCTFKYLRGRNMTKMVARPGAGMYSDNFEVADIYCEPVIGAEWQVDIGGLGDGLEISKLHFPYNALNPGNGTPLGLRVTGVYGGTVTGCVGGDVFVQRARVDFIGNHYERAQFEVDGANVSLLGNYFSAKDRVPVVLSNSSSHGCNVAMRDNEFTHLSGLLDWVGNDVSVATGVTLNVDNCYRRFSRNSALDISQLHGILLQDAAGNAMPAWNKFAYEFSRSGRVLRGNVVRPDLSISSGTAPFTGLSAIASDSGEVWQAASATYFYRAQYILDVDRLVGRNQTSGEQSLARTNGGAGVRLTLAYNKPANCLLRVYRGTSTGSYDQFVDIPVQSCTLLYDNGLNLNGFPWASRTAGAEATLNGMGESHYRAIGPRSILDAAATPSVGSWSVGDEIYRTAPAAAGKRAWVCTTAGTPGTWKPWGGIDA